MSEFPLEVIERARAAQASLVPLMKRLQAVPFPVTEDGPEPQDSWKWIARGGGAA